MRRRISRAEFTLPSRVAIVTGGSHGIGEAISLRFAQAGANVVIACRNIELGKEVAAHIQSMGRLAILVPVDVAKKEQVEHMVERVVQEFNRIDVLVNNAGGASGDTFHAGKVLDISERDWDDTMAVNLKGVFLCSQAIARVMKYEKKGNIINIASICGQIPYAGLSAYSAAKAAVINFTRALAMELAPDVRVNAIAPGRINTPRTTKDETHEHVISTLSNIPLSRYGQPEDVASMALYLASDAANWITGAIMDVNGGQKWLAERGQPYYLA